MARPVGALAVPVGAVLVVTALLTGVFLVFSEQIVASVPALGSILIGVLATAVGTFGLYLLLSAWSRLASGPGAAHPRGRRLRLALLLLSVAASSVLVALPSAGALLVDIGHPSASPGSGAATYVRAIAGVVVGSASGAWGAFLLRDVRRRRDRHRQRAQQRQQQRERQRQRQQRALLHVPEQRDKPDRRQATR